MLKKIFCCGFCKNTYTDPFKNMSDKTQLLPFSKIETGTQQYIAEQKQVIFYGDVPQEMSRVPFQIKNFGDEKKFSVEKIVFGNSHCLILFKGERKQIGVFGSNENGQLGVKYKLNSDNYYHKPILNEIEEFSNCEFAILDIAAGSDFSLILVEETETKKTLLYRFELAEKDQHGTNNKNNNLQWISVIQKEEFKYNKRIKKICSKEKRIVVLTEDNCIYIKDSLFTMEIIGKFKLLEQFDPSNPIIDIQLGINHCMFLSQNGQLYSLGHNQYGELGIDAAFGIISLKSMQISFFEKLEVQKFSVGGRHNLVLTKQGVVFAFGDNSEGQCSGEAKNYSSPIEVKFPVDEENVTDICCGYSHSIAVTANNNVYAWGDTAFGKLGFPPMKMYEYNPTNISSLRFQSKRTLFAGINQTSILIESDES